MARDNRLLGQFNLEGIPAAPRGMPQIEVRFDIDANGILNVAAKDLGTGKEQTVRIEQSAGLSDDEIQRMQKDAQSHAEEDKKKKALAEARNDADTRTYAMEKLIKEHEDKLSDADKTAVSASIEKVRAAAKEDDADAIRSALSELEAASHALSKTLYDAGQKDAGAQAAGEAPHGANGASGAPADDDAIDAEFEVKDS